MLAKRGDQRVGPIGAVVDEQRLPVESAQPRRQLRQQRARLARSL
jgi:hypothetical protein